MDDTNKNWPNPDYEGWQDVTTKLIWLPPKRFYFVVTMLTMAGVSYLVSDSLWAFAIVVTLTLAFATCVFFMHWRNDGDGQEEKDCSIESSDYDRAARETRSLDGDVELREHDGHGPTSPRSVRTSLEGERKRSADNHP